ncbi:MAG: DUF697 domain-containing protein [Acetobacteraceae bacterium]
MNAFTPGFADQPRPAEAPETKPAPTHVAPLEPGFIETSSRAPEAEVFVPPPVAPADTVPRSSGMLTWIAIGLALLVLGGATLAIIGFVMDQMARSQALGTVSIAVMGAGVAALLGGVLIELRSYRRLTVVDRMRARLRDPACPAAEARRTCQDWLSTVDTRLPDAPAVGAALEACRTTDEVRALMRHGPLEVLREKARGLGKRAGMQAGFLVAITPSPALDGLVAGLRSLSLIREVASLYGLRPGLSVTIGLLRRCAWTAASVYGVNVAASVAATNLLAEAPVLRHVAASVPGAGLTATRLYWLSQAVAEACSPVETET